MFGKYSKKLKNFQHKFLNKKSLFFKSFTGFYVFMISCGFVFLKSFALYYDML